MVAPVMPETIIERVTQLVPPETVNAINSLILSTWDGLGATVPVDSVMRAVERTTAEQGDEEERHRILQHCAAFLSITPEFVLGIYRATGWSVEYKEPAGSDWRSATFTFAWQKIASTPQD